MKAFPPSDLRPSALAIPRLWIRRRRSFKTYTSTVTSPMGKTPWDAASGISARDPGFPHRAAGGFRGYGPPNIRGKRVLARQPATALLLNQTQFLAPLMLARHELSICLLPKQAQFAGSRIDACYVARTSRIRRLSGPIRARMLAVSLVSDRRVARVGYGTAAAARRRISRSSGTMLYSDTRASARRT